MDIKFYKYNLKGEQMSYQDLIDRVSTIDPKAGDYLRGPARELDSFTEDSVLDGCFVWEDSRQGHDYWSKIYKAMRYDNPTKNKESE